MRVGSRSRTGILPWFDLLQLWNDGPAGGTDIRDPCSWPRIFARYRRLAMCDLYGLVSTLVLSLRTSHVAERHVSRQLNRLPANCNSRNRLNGLSEMQSQLEQLAKRCGRPGSLKTRIAV